jgi:hypothetical protein
MAKKRNEPEVIDIPSEPSTSMQLAPLAGGDLARIEIDRQISTAKQYPRDLAQVRRTASELVAAHLAMTRDPKDGLYYSMSRGRGDDRKIIEGPNVRLAEIVQHSYGNSRAAARTTGIDERFVFVEGIFHDLESNTAIRMEVKRRITTSEGRRYGDDMIGVTENAACAIAYRNAVLKGIPKAIWWELYNQARKISGGVTVAQTKEKRVEAVEWLTKKGIPEKNILERLGVKKVSDIDADKLATLKGICTAIANKETTSAREFNLTTERTTSDVKSSPINPEGKITKNQMLDILTLFSDYKLSEGDGGKALVAIGHKGTLESLPQSKLAALHKELEKRKR